MKKFKIAALILAFALTATAASGCTLKEVESTDGDGQLSTETTEQGGNSENDSPDGSENNVVPPIDDKDNTLDKDGEIIFPTIPDDNNHIEVPAVELLGYADVGERYSTVVKPVYDAAVFILNDLIENDEATFPDEFYNPRVTSIRCSGLSLTIFYCYDVYIGDSGVKSEFLEQEIGVDIGNFSESNGESYNELYLCFKNFLITEREYEMSDRYEEVVTPLAEEVAEMFLNRYKKHKDEMTVSVLNFGKNIVIKADSSLAETHKMLIDKINETLLKITEDYYLPKSNDHFPLLTNQDIEISFGGNIYDEIIYSRISISVNFQNFRYYFYAMPFNQDGRFTADFICRLEGSPAPGYNTGTNLLNPSNEEYAELIKELDLESLELPLAYSGNPTNYFTTLCSENTFLYF